MLTEFRIELGRIMEAWPDTHAAEEASDLLFEHDAPELSIEEARDRVERAEGLLKAAGRPAELYEACLLLTEVWEGHFDSDEIVSRAEELLSSLGRDRGEELISGETEARTLQAEVELLHEEVLRGGALLSREKADSIADRLSAVAKRSGGGTLLARRIEKYVADLAQSFEGPPHMGVRLDHRFPGPGVRIARVEANTGAAKAGLATGDVILKFGGATLSSVNDLTKALAERKSGETVLVEVRRVTGEVEVLELPLGRRLR
jgi:hypothetical protein